jgi:hypothetical protein
MMTSIEEILAGTDAIRIVGKREWTRMAVESGGQLTTAAS